MNQFNLLKTKRFLPLFITQFLGSFNDNLFRSALAVLITYQFTGSSITWLTAGVMVALCSTLLVIPFPILSPIAGQLADKYNKATLIRIVKISEVIIMSVAAYGFVHGQLYLLMFMLLMGGVHSAFFGPLKFSILSDHLEERELLAGNSLIAGGTYASVLAGLIFGGVLLDLDHSGILIGGVLVTGALMGLISSFFIMPTIPASPDLRLNHNFIKEAIKIVKYTKSNRSVFLPILGLSWFLLIAAVFMGQFPTYAKAVGANSEVYSLFLVIFSLGIGLGAVICHRILRGKISARYTPVASLFISVFMISLVLSSAQSTTNELVGIHDFTSNINNWPLMISMLGIAIAGGIKIVPLYTLMQARADAKFRSRVIAARNVLNSVFITAAMVISAAILAAGLDVFDLFLIIGISNLAVTIQSARLLPEVHQKLLKQLKI
jgi:acyl-[acyl-carrier-protein]-phospholipid O-acyltransferase/long-chain-fatty-acid--[acyl-carrier-protein] ligase